MVRACGVGGEPIQPFVLSAAEAHEARFPSSLPPNGSDKALFALNRHAARQARQEPRTRP